MKSMSQLIAQYIFSGEMKLTEALKFSANDTAENIADYLPHPYPNVPSSLVSYVEKRLAAIVERDQTLALANGNCLSAIRKVLIENQKSIYTLMDGLKITGETKGMEAQHEKIKRMVKLHQDNKFPEEYFHKGSKVQALDIRDRDRARSL